MSFLQLKIKFRALIFLLKETPQRSTPTCEIVNMLMKIESTISIVCCMNNDILRVFLNLMVRDIYSLLVQLQILTAPKTMKSIPAILLTIAIPPFVSFF
jgi:hypothetical protein